MVDESTAPVSKKSKISTRLQETAFELFKHRPANVGSARQIAIQCYRSAEAFLQATDELIAGTLNITSIDQNPLDEAYAPNLKKTHPINLMSRHWGSVDKVRKTLAALKSEPEAKAYEPYGWGLPEVNQARALFPALVKKADELEEKITKPGASN